MISRQPMRSYSVRDTQEGLGLHLAEKPVDAVPGPAGNSGIEIDAEDSVQNLVPRNNSQRFEGIAFSPSGDVIAVTASDTNEVFLFKRKSGGRFENEPCGSLSGPRSGLDYPHDISFCVAGGAEFFAVAQRTGSVSIYQMDEARGTCGAEPVFRLSGPQARLNFSDGVAFVPPKMNYLAICSLETDLISFYRETKDRSVRFEPRPSFCLKGGSLCQPDGLAFSENGEWLAVANHGNHTVSVFRRNRGILSALGPRYGPQPVTVIRDPGLCYPHSVAFTPIMNHLVVTNAGANYFSVYALSGDDARPEWAQTPVLRQAVGPDNAFEKVNVRNKREGGPKGVAIHGNSLAVCSPEHGVLIYSFLETGATRGTLRKTPA